MDRCRIAQSSARGKSRKHSNVRPPPGRWRTELQPKDLMGQPWRLAFAMQDAGWYLRQDVIWHKPNPMPESVLDRCTKAYDYVFLLTKSERYDRPIQGTGQQDAPGHRGIRKRRRTSPYESRLLDYASKVREAGGIDLRNKRSVWTIPTQSFDGAHFATFPEALVEPCVLAGSRAGDIVFDPFFGSGTTGQVASRLGRHFIGCELNRDYGPLQRDRLRQPGLELA
jgi:site-specific DNA-methyltransferase (cytosine-N4-specific)